MNANPAIFLICMSVLAVTCYVIAALKNKPARIVAVIMALTALVGTLKPLVAMLGGPQSNPVVAPSALVTSTPASPSASLTVSSPGTDGTEPSNPVEQSEVASSPTASAGGK